MNKIAILVVSTIVGFALFYQPGPRNEIVLPPPPTLEDVTEADQLAAFTAREDSLKETTLQDLKGLDVKTIVAKLAEGDRVEDVRIGIAGTLSMQWVRFEYLKKIASPQELVALTRHKNAVVRCYAFRALVDKKPDKVFSVLLQHLHDTTMVTTQSGCTGLTMQTRAYFLMIANLTPEQQAKLNRLLPDSITYALR
jgi:hypothetical protein